MAVLLGIDLETTGLDENTGHIAEVGLVMWDTHRQHPVKMVSLLCNTYDEAWDGNEASQINGIGVKDTESYGYTWRHITDTYITLWKMQADYIVAHNAEFEQKWLRAKGVDPTTRPWIDTMTDLPYPNMKGGGSLSEILMNHGIFNPLPHRGLTDALAMMQLLAKYPFEEVEKLALTPSMVIVARVDYGNKELARNLDYKWNRSVPNQWAKKIKVDKYDLEQQLAYNAGFEVYKAQKEEPCPTS